MSEYRTNDEPGIRYKCVTYDPSPFNSLQNGLEQTRVTYVRYTVISIFTHKENLRHAFRFSKCHKFRCDIRRSTSQKLLCVRDPNASEELLRDST